MEKDGLTPPNLDEWGKAKWRNITSEEFLSLYDSAEEAKTALNSHWENRKFNGHKGVKIKAILEHLDQCITRREATKTMGKTAVVAGTIVTVVGTGLTMLFRWKDGGEPIEKKETPKSILYAIEIFREIYQGQKPDNPESPESPLNLTPTNKLSEILLKAYSHVIDNFSDEIPEGIERPTEGSLVPQFFQALFAHHGYFLEFEIPGDEEERLFSALCFPLVHGNDTSDTFTVDLSQYIEAVPALEGARELGLDQKCYRVKQPVLLSHCWDELLIGKENVLKSDRIYGTFTPGGHILVFSEHIRRAGYSEASITTDEAAHAISARLIPKEILRSKTGPIQMMFNPQALHKKEITRSEVPPMVKKDDPALKDPELIPVTFGGIHQLDEMFSIAFRHVFGKEELCKGITLHISQEWNKENYDSAEDFFQTMYSCYAREHYSQIHDQLSHFPDFAEYFSQTYIAGTNPISFSKNLPASDKDAHDYFLRLLYVMKQYRDSKSVMGEGSKTSQINPEAIFVDANKAALTIIVGGINALRMSIYGQNPKSPDVVNETAQAEE